jgi:hypothetical protein
MRCRDFVAGLLLAGAGRRRATRRREQQQRSGGPPHGAASSGRPMSRCGTNAKCRPALRLSAYRGRPEVIGAQSEWREGSEADVEPSSFRKYRQAFRNSFAAGVLPYLPLPKTERDWPCHLFRPRKNL